MIKKPTYLLFILLTTNNVIYTLTDLNGNVKLWTSLGFIKIKGTKKFTLTSLKFTLTNLLVKVKFSKIHIIFKGVSKHKKFLLKYIKQTSLNILSICDHTLKAHNGCKLKKKRRL